VSADEKIYLTSDFGVRPFLVGSLFHDHLDEESNEVPAEPIRQWIAKLPPSDPLEHESRRMAELYWRMRTNPASIAVYAIGRQPKGGAVIDDLPERPASYPWICSMKEKGAGRDDSIRRIRLAILFLLLREHQYKVHRRQMADEVSDECKRLLSLIDYDLESVGELLEELRRAAWGKGLAEQYNDLLEEFLMFMRKLVIKHDITEIYDNWELDVTEADVVRLVDPFPTSWDVAVSLDKATKIGKGLPVLKTDDMQGMDVRALLAGDASCLTRMEIICARRYARELALAEADWPEWLRLAE
jgi:hypothetical protein